MNCLPCTDHGLTACTNRLKSTEIIEKICKFLNLPMNEVLSKNRYRQLVQARYIIAFVLKRDRYLNLSLNNIAFCIGNRDHSTIVHSLKTIENEMDIYEDFRQLMYDIFFYLYESDIYFPDKYKLKKAV